MGLEVGYAGYADLIPSLVNCQELRQAAEYGLALLEANEELQLQVATLQIRLETETDELAAERDAFRRRHEHALLEMEHWRRRLARAEDDKAALCERMEAAAALSGADDTTFHLSGASAATSALRRTITQLQEQVDKLEATTRAQGATITALRAWKAAAERQQEEAHASEEVAARHNLEMVERLEHDQARLLRAIAQLEADAKRRMQEESEDAQRVADKDKEIARLGDELAALRVDNSALRESLLTAEARSSRLQRELALLEHVSYFSEAVVDMDTEEDDDEDEVDEDEQEEGVEPADKARASSSTTEQERTKTLTRSRSSMRRRRSSTATTSGSYSAFPSTSVAPDGRRVALTPTDVETHTKLHHYFHLTAQSIIHENKLHERCFSTSSRFTIDMWYREIVQKDVPFLEWHSWLIDRISHVAASVRDADGDDSATSSAPLSAESKTTASNVSSGSTASSSSTSSARPARVSFSVARAFFRLLWKSSARGERHSDASTP